MAEITADQIKAAEADFVALKARKNVSATDKQTAAEALTQLRQAFRVQEEEAGRRSGLVQVEE